MEEWERQHEQELAQEKMKEKKMQALKAQVQK